MAVTINADTSNGLVMTPDTSGEIKLQSAGADIATVDSSGITMASGKTLPAEALTGTLPALDGSSLTGVLPYTAQSLSGSGYITLAGGLKINWVTTGTTTATSGTTAFTWASAFTTIYGAVVAQSLATDSGEIGVNRTTSGGTVDFYAWSGTTKAWTIIGIGV